jgi:hypothetical protein
MVLSNGSNVILKIALKSIPADAIFQGWLRMINYVLLFCFEYKL